MNAQICENWDFIEAHKSAKVHPIGSRSLNRIGACHNKLGSGGKVAYMLRRNVQDAYIVMVDDLEPEQEHRLADLVDIGKKAFREHACLASANLSYDYVRKKFRADMLRYIQGNSLMASRLDVSTFRFAHKGALYAWVAAPSPVPNFTSYVIVREGLQEKEGKLEKVVSGASCEASRANLLDTIKEIFSCPQVCKISWGLTAFYTFSLLAMGSGGYFFISEAVKAAHGLESFLNFGESLFGATGMLILCFELCLGLLADMKARHTPCSTLAQSKN